LIQVARLSQTRHLTHTSQTARRAVAEIGDFTGRILVHGAAE
jgi:hypothetical protein